MIWVVEEPDPEDDSEQALTAGSKVSETLVREEGVVAGDRALLARSSGKVLLLRRIQQADETSFVERRYIAWKSAHQDIQKRLCLDRVVAPRTRCFLSEGRDLETLFGEGCRSAWVGRLDIRDLGRLCKASKALAACPWPEPAQSANLGHDWFHMSVDLVTALVTRLGSDKEPRSVYRATLVLAAGARHSAQNQKAISSAGAVSRLVEQLKANHELTSPAAAMTLGHLAASRVALFDYGLDAASRGSLYTRDNEDVQEAIMDSGAVTALVNALTVEKGPPVVNPSEAIQETCVRALYTLADNHQEWHHEVLTSCGAITVLLRLAQEGTTATKDLAADSLARLGGHRPSFLVALEMAGGIKMLTPLFTSPSTRARCSAAILLGNLLQSEECQDIVKRPDFGILSPLIGLLCTGLPDERSSAMWALSRLNCRHSHVLAAVTSMGALEKLCTILKESVSQGLSSDDLLLDVLELLTKLVDDENTAQKLRLAKFQAVLLQVAAGKCRVKERGEEVKQFLTSETKRLALSVLETLSVGDETLKGQIASINTAKVPAPPPPPPATAARIDGSG